jgi:hypothetical protein
MNIFHDFLKIFPFETEILLEFQPVFLSGKDFRKIIVIFQFHNRTDQFFNFIEITILNDIFIENILYNFDNQFLGIFSDVKNSSNKKS